MSFLSSVLSSIETGAVPPPPLVRPGAGDGPSAAKPTTSNKPTTPQNGGKQVAGQKRKATSDLSPAGRVGTPARLSPVRSKTTSAPSTNRSTPARDTSKPPTTKQSAAAAAKTPVKAGAKPAVESKPPPKGSYADIMAQAKALQSKVPTHVGLIKHQAAQKERLSKLQLKKMQKEAKQHGNGIAARGKGQSAPYKGTAAAAAAAAKLRSPLRKPPSPPYKGTSRTTPAKDSGPVYKGTAGRPPRHGIKNGMAGRKKTLAGRPSKVDRYLGTDEEDEGDYDDEEYYSDESMVMEAGIMDMEEEEQKALRIARAEDEAELKAEMAAKKAKEERKKKLQQLSCRR